MNGWSIPDRVREWIEVHARRDSFDDNPCFYLYDLGAIADRIAATTAALPDPFVLYYAMKANPHPEILDLVANHPGIAGVDVSSQGELLEALRFFPAAEISFTGPAKLPVELRCALDAGIGRIHLESQTEAQRLSALAKRPVSALVRLNSALRSSSPSNPVNGAQFGIDGADFLDAVAEIAKLPNISVEGVHSFPGSGLLDAEEAVAFACRILTVAEQVQLRGVPVRTVNVGGGFGVGYTEPQRHFDVVRYGSELSGHPLVQALGLESIVIDLGRFLVAEAGYYVTEIVDIKRSGDSVHVIVAGGINHQRRPYAHNSNMPISVLPRNGSRSPIAVRDTTVMVNGPTLASYDVLGRNVWMESADVGDLLVLGLAGAYGLNLAPVEFLLRPKAAEYAIAAEPRVTAR